MNCMARSWRIGPLGLLALVMLAACVAGGYDGDVGVGYVGGVYEPCCYDYGGWGGGYRVGPPRGGERGCQAVARGQRSVGGTWPAAVDRVQP